MTVEKLIKWLQGFPKDCNVDVAIGGVFESAYGVFRFEGTNTVCISGRHPDLEPGGSKNLYEEEEYHD